MYGRRNGPSREEFAVMAAPIICAGMAIGLYNRPPEELAKKAKALTEALAKEMGFQTEAEMEEEYNKSSAEAEAASAGRGK
jgi:hypothetical protein